MAAAVYSFTKPTDVSGFVLGDRKARFFDWTSDTGDYAAGGVTKTAASLGFKHIDFAAACGVGTQGTSGASSLSVGMTYLSGGTSVQFQLYESAATGLPMLEKNAEAMVANFTVRLLVVGK